MMQEIYRERGLDLSRKFPLNLINDYLRKTRRGGKPVVKKDTDLPDIHKVPAGIEPPPLSKEAVERWMNFPRYRAPFTAGTSPEGIPYDEGEILYVGPFQVMGNFEKPLFEALSGEVFNGRRGPLTVCEAGFGMGILAELNIEKMKKRGGTYYIVELNKQIYNEDLVPWAEAKEKEIANDPASKPVKIVPIHGDIGEVLDQEKLRDVFFDLMFSDTFYLQENHKGVNDLIYLDKVARHLKDTGRYGFPPFHEGNQTASIDNRQYMLLSRYFSRYSTSIARVIAPKECNYMQGVKYLPGVSFKGLRRAA